MAVIITKKQDPAAQAAVPPADKGEAAQQDEALASGPDEPHYYPVSTGDVPRILTPENAARTVRSFGGTKAHPVEDFDPGLALSIVAQGGAGKTTLEGTAMESEVINGAVLLDANANAQVLTSPPDPKFLDRVALNNWEHLDAIIDEFMSGGHKDIDLLMWDNVSASYDQNYNDWHAKYKDGRKAYGMAQSDLTVTTRKLLRLAEGRSSARGRPLHVIFIFQEVTEDRLIPNETTGELEIAPRREINLSNKMQGLFPSMVPFMGFLAVTKSENRVLDFRASPQTQAKWQARQIDLFRTIPHLLYKPSLGPLFDTLVGGKPFPVARFKMPAPVLSPNTNKTRRTD